MSSVTDNDTPPPNVPDVTEPNDDHSKRSSSRQEYNTETLARLQQNMVKAVDLMGVPIIALVINGVERLCLAQISNTLLKQYSYNEVHNRRVALGINCVQCTPVQLEILRRAGAMPVSSRRCGMITKREAERLCKSFLSESAPPKLPDDFSFHVFHKCAWGCKGTFVPSRYNSSRAKCIQCDHCRMYFSPNKFIFHSHRFSDSTYTQPDAANFNNWRRHLHLIDKSSPDPLNAAWEDVKAMFNGGTRKRFLTAAISGHNNKSASSTEGPSVKHVKQSIASQFGSSSSFGNSFSPPKSLESRSPWFFNPYAAFGNTLQTNRFLPTSFPMLSATHLMPNPVSLLSPELISQRMESSLMMPLVRDTLRNEVSTHHGSETPHNFSMTRNQDTPVLLQESEGTKKPYQKLSKEELQELLMGEIEARRRLEQDLVVLKGTYHIVSEFPTSK